MKTILYVGLGGGVGSIFRYLTAVFVNRYFTTTFPLATFITNVIGCFLIGVMMSLLEKSNVLDGPLKWLLVTGFCGGYTTFSTFAFENIQLMQNQQTLWALTYSIGSIVIGVISVWLGMIIAK